MEGACASSTLADMGSVQTRMQRGCTSEGDHTGARNDVAVGADAASAVAALDAPADACEPPSRCEVSAAHSAPPQQHFLKKSRAHGPLGDGTVPTERKAGATPGRALSPSAESNAIAHRFMTFVTHPDCTPFYVDVYAALRREPHFVFALGRRVDDAVSCNKIEVCALHQHDASGGNKDGDGDDSGRGRGRGHGHRHGSAGAGAGTSTRGQSAPAGRPWAENMINVVHLHSVTRTAFLPLYVYIQTGVLNNGLITPDNVAAVHVAADFLGMATAAETLGTWAQWAGMTDVTHTVSLVPSRQVLSSSSSSSSSSSLSLSLSSSSSRAVSAAPDRPEHGTAPSALSVEVVVNTKVTFKPGVRLVFGDSAFNERCTCMTWTYHLPETEAWMLESQPSAHEADALACYLAATARGWKEQAAQMSKYERKYGTRLHAEFEQRLVQTCGLQYLARAIAEVRDRIFSNAEQYAAFDVRNPYHFIACLDRVPLLFPRQSNAILRVLAWALQDCLPVDLTRARWWLHAFLGVAACCPWFARDRDLAATANTAAITTRGLCWCLASALAENMIQDIARTSTHLVDTRSQRKVRREIRDLLLVAYKCG